MSKLGELLAKPGALAVGEFNRDGKMVGFQSRQGVPKELGAMASQFAATIEMLMGTFGASFSELTRLPLVPFHGWLYSGGQRTSTIQARLWTIYETSASGYCPPDVDEAVGLEELLELPGVCLAAYYTPDGTEIACKQTLGFDRALRATMTELVASGTATFRGLSTAFGHLSKAPWGPTKVWIYSGGDWMIAASPTCWLLAEAGEGDVTELHAALIR
jgi:roadblock/LC7 domain-containing protein